ncbi:DNA topoisomerase 2 [Massospora cicadina]|nr:DNA topoisomerase 2 [Massospora cicadina]
MIEDWRLNSDMIKDYEKHHSDLGMSYIVQVSEASMKYNKLSNQACFILAIINEELEMCNVTHANLIKQLIEMAFDPINTKDDNGATNSGFKYLLDIKIISMNCELVEKLIRVRDAKFEEIEVIHAKSPLDLYNDDLNLFLKLWEETVE